jgi:hypothetical protein
MNPSKNGGWFTSPTGALVSASGRGLRRRHGTQSACDTWRRSRSSLPTSYETEHLRIGTDLGHPLCAGDLAAYEAVIRRTEDELGFSMASKYSVSIWSDEAWETVGREYCGRRALGCTFHDKEAIFTSLSAVDHELAHAVISIDNLTPFFAEGLADVYGGDTYRGSQTRFGFTAPADSLELAATEIDQRTSQHFVRWLRETWDGTKLGELARLGKRADERFDEVYGLSFAEAQAMYLAEAPWGYPSLDSCGGAPLEFADDLGGWRVTVELDCDTSEDVRAIGFGVATFRTLDVPVAGHYSVSSDADGLLLSRCATGPIEEPIRLDEFLGDDILPSYAGELSEEFSLYEGGSVLDLYFESGKHEIGLFLLGYEPRETFLAIWPSLGPRPVEEGY